MRKKNRSFLLMSLISASLLVSVFTIAQAQGPAAAKATNWSDPATWPNRKVPVAGDKVTYTPVADYNAHSGQFLDVSRNKRIILQKFDQI